MTESNFILNPIGVIESPLKDRKGAPRQGYEGAPDVWIEIHADVADGLDGTKIGDDVIVLTWLHQSQRDTLKVYPRWDPNNGLWGVFATRSPDRPNPIGLHRVKVLEIDGNRIKVGPIEAIDGTPVVDIKPVLTESADS